MIKKIFSFLAIIFICSSAALAAVSFRIEHKKELYLRVFQGKEDGLNTNTTGELYDFFGQQIGTFRVKVLEQFEVLAVVQLAGKRSLSEVSSVGIRSLNKEDLRFLIPQSESFFYLSKGEIHGLRNGMKGSVYKENKEIGLFRLLAVEKDYALGLITNLQVGYNFRDAQWGRVKNYWQQIIENTSFVNLNFKNFVMLLIGFFFIFIAIKKDYEPLLLIPIGFGILLGNIPLPLSLFNNISVYMIDPLTHQYAFNTTGNSVFGLLYYLVTSGIFPPLIFLGIGAMTDFSTLLANPRAFLLGAAAQFGIYAAFGFALLFGFAPQAAASIGIIGGADGPTAIFLSSKLAPTLLGPIAIAAYSYMGMVPIIQPPIMKLLTTEKERKIRMKKIREVSKAEKIVFPIVGIIITSFIAPGALPLLGMLFFGNLLKESGVTGRLAKTAASSLIDICTMILGLMVGASTSAQVFLTPRSVLIFVLGCVAFAFSTAAGVLFAKFMNLFLKEKINPLIGSAGVSAVPDSARVSEMIGRQYDPENHLLMHAMGPNISWNFLARCFMEKILTVVPNICEGRDAQFIADLILKLQSLPGCIVLDYSSDQSRNRTVISFTGSKETIFKAGELLYETVLKKIDMRQHEGDYPRLGAVDVFPFVPIKNISIQEAVSWSEEFAQLIATKFELPVYLFAESARYPTRREIENIREGEYEGLEQKLADPRWKPDFGPAVFKPESGATIIGARFPLVSFKVYLPTKDETVVKRIADAVHFKNGGLQNVKTYPGELVAENLSEMTVAISNYQQTPIYRVIELIKNEASYFNLHISRIEPIGLIPENALLDVAVYYMRLHNFSYDKVLEKSLQKHLE